MFVEKIIGEDKDAKIENDDALRTAVEEALGVVILFPSRDEGTNGRLAKAKALLEMKFKHPSEEERKEMSRQMCKAFNLKDEKIQLNKNPVVVHTYAGGSDHQMGEFDVGDNAIKAIKRKLKDGEIVVIDKTVAFSTYPVGNHNSTDDTWNILTGRDCAATKKLVSRVICAAGGEYQRYWKNLRPMFSTIARQKLDVVRGVFSNSDYKNSAASFCTVHADATSYIAPGDPKGE